MAIEYIRRTPTQNQEYFNQQLTQAVNTMVNRLNIPYEKVRVSSYDVKVDDMFLDVSVNQATTLTLPKSPPIGTNLIIKDSSGSAGTHNITITANTGNTIEGSTSKLINTNYGVLSIIYDGTNKWLTF